MKLIAPFVLRPTLPISSFSFQRRAERGREDRAAKQRWSTKRQTHNQILRTMKTKGARERDGEREMVREGEGGGSKSVRARQRVE
jgi:hypothetical protein